jgi:hypothetical protein
MLVALSMTGETQILIEELELGNFPKDRKLVVRVDSMNKGTNPRGPKFYGRLSDPTGELRFSLWDEAAPFRESDKVELTNLFKVSEYEGKLELQLGRYFKVSKAK